MVSKIQPKRAVVLFLLWGTLFGCLYYIGVHIAMRSVTPWDIIAYIAVIILVKIVLFPNPLPKLNIDKTGGIFLAITISIHLLLLSIIASIPWHFHFDEFIVSFTSLTLPPLSKLNVFGAYPPLWVAQFPLLFYMLQKPFLLFGPSVWAVRISVWPYAIGICLYLYILISSLWTKQLARITTILFVFFAPQLYIASTGLHFISSEFFYLAALTHFILFFKKKSTTHLFPLTLYTVACYLTYTSSYAILPVLVISTLLIVILRTSERKFFITGITKVVIAVCIMFLPFLLYHFLDTPFLTQRFNQVNILNGSWSTTAEKLASGIPMGSIVIKQTKDALFSLIIPGIGGMGGYEYGHEALFTPIEAVLFTIGIVIILVMIRKKEREFPVTYGVLIIIPLITGFILTTHPPPFHRISILYPWFCIPFALAVNAGTEYVTRYIHIRKGVFTAILVIATCIYSLIHCYSMIWNDRRYTNWDSVRITRIIDQSVKPGLPILIGSDNMQFHYLPELTFRFGTKRTVSIEEKEKVITTYQGNGPLLLRYATDEDVAGILTRYPKARVYHELENLPLEYMTLIIPQSSFKNAE
jgi:hypothetical protein